MNILGISGSPREGGNSEMLLKASLEPFAEAKWDINQILLSEKKIEMCIGCDRCLNSHKCFINDDMLEIYEAFEVCDAIIISAPAYFRNIPAQLKAVFDRSYAMPSNPLRGKLGGAIAVGASSGGGGQAMVLTIIYNFYLSRGALCVPGELNGVTASADKRGDILAQPRRLEQAKILGENIITYAAKQA